jgi:hypothetical protein
VAASSGGTCRLSGREVADRRREAITVKVSVVRSGGIAGMTTTTTVDTADLSPDAAAGLRRTVDACSFDAPESADPAVRDGLTHEVTVADDDGIRRVRYGQGRAPAGVDALVRLVDGCPQGSREVGR